jgi:ABC-2 type transport system ATP-binding protein
LSISVTNITKQFGSQKALDNVSFEVSKGQIVGFLGPNGAGKSTMMKILTCFIPQTEGSASVGGFDVNEQPIEVRKRIGYLPEHNPLYTEMYVREYLDFVAAIYKLTNRTKRVNEMIELTGLEIEQKKKIGALSKGYRQRVGLAQAMIHNPEVLILDEPTSGLDPNQLAEIRNVIKTAGREKTVMLSTHIMQEVEAICDRVIIINRGVIVANDTTGMLQSMPQSSEVVVIEFDKPVTQKQLLSISSVSTAENTGGNQWRISSKGNTDIRSILFKWSVDNGYSVLTMQKQEQKLENIFQQLTNKK